MGFLFLTLLLEELPRMVHSTPALADLPPEMIAAVEVDAERQAEGVAEFLGTLGEDLLDRHFESPVRGV